MMLDDDCVRIIYIPFYIVSHARWVKESCFGEEYFSSSGQNHFGSKPYQSNIRWPLPWGMIHD